MIRKPTNGTMQPLRNQPTLVHLVPAFHYDVAYCKTFQDYLPKSLEIIRKGLRLLKQNKDFTFCIEQVILAREYWQRYPRDRRWMKQAAQSGRLHFAPGMFTMPDSNIPSGENFIRNALIGRQWLQKHLGVTSDCCWMADIFGHNPQTPQLAQTCGYQSYMFERGKSGSWDTSFLWQGLDGTKIPAQWEVDTYYGINLALAWIKDRPYDWIKKRLYREIIQPLQAHTPCPTVLMSPVGGDFLMPDQRCIDFIRAWNRKEKDVQFIFSTPRRYFSDLHRAKVRLKTGSDDLNPLMEGCWSSRIRIKQYNRRLEETAASLELLETITGDSHASSERLWMTLAWNAFHDIICGTLEKKAAREALALYAAAEKRADREIRARLTRLARQTLPGNSRRRAHGKSLILFNSLPYPRREIISLPASNAFCSADLPATGWCYVPLTRKAGTPRARVMVQDRGRIIENHLIRIEFAPNGTIGSLVDKRRKKEFAIFDNGMNNPKRQPDYGDLWAVGAGPINGSLLRTTPLNQPMPTSGARIRREDRISAGAADADCYSWPVPQVVHRHPLQGTVEFRYPDIGVTTQVTMRAADPVIRFRTTFMPQGKRYRLCVAFPTTIRTGKIRQAVPCGHLQRPEGEYPAQGWMDYADLEKGLLLLNRGLPGNNVTAGVMMLSLFRAVSMESQEQTAWYEKGIEQVFEYALMPFDPQDPHYDPARQAALFNRPVVAINMAAPDHAVPDHGRSLVELRGDGAELSCLRREGDRFILRLWESRGRHSRVGLAFKDTIRSCLRTDAVGNRIQVERCQPKSVAISLRPFEIATFEIVPA